MNIAITIDIDTVVDVVDESVEQSTAQSLDEGAKLSFPGGVGAGAIGWPMENRVVHKKARVMTILASESYAILQWRLFTCEFVCSLGLGCVGVHHSRFIIIISSRGVDPLGNH